MARIEQSTYTFFEGNNWWVYESFLLKGDVYAYLLREDPLMISYGKLEDGQLVPVSVEMKQRLAERYQQILIGRLLIEGKEAVPRVGKVRNP